MPVDLPRRLLAEVVGSFGFFFIGFTGIAALTTEGSSAIEAVGALNLAFRTPGPELERIPDQPPGRP